VHAGVVALTLDPLSGAAHLITHMLTSFIETGRDDLYRVLDRYLFTTVDTTHRGAPFTANPNLRRLNIGLALAGDVLLAAVLTFASLRSMFERSLHAKYSLKVMLPRALLAVVLMHGSLVLMQMGIDLNNAMAHVAVYLGDGLGGTAGTPWASPLSPSSISDITLSADLFHAVFAIALLIAVVILVFAYVVRTALLSILLVTAPLAALGTALPETRGYAHTWLRLFLTSLFMQPIQLIVLRVSMVMAFSEGSGIFATLYALATLWIMLKVPGAMSTAAHMETKARTYGHELVRHATKALHPAHRSTTHGSGA
jgi:hypothetical protein